MRALLFCKRNGKEILRDPLSYIFCLGFPLIMLLMFQVINHYAQGTYWFSLEYLTPGISVFSFAFVMLFMTLLVSKDRLSSFLTRLYTSPMSTTDFIIGYTLPGMVLGILQTIVCFLASFVIGLFTDVSFNLGGMLLCMLCQIPAMLLFVGFGILFGSSFTDKSGPAVSSLIISFCGLISGAWMPLDTMGGLETFCKFFPFYPAVCIGRVAMSGTAPTFANFWGYLLIVCGYAVVIYAFSVLMFRRKMTSDNN